MDSPSAFISYAGEDHESASRLSRDLTREGVKTWLDKESLLPGQRWEVAVRKAIETSRFFLALISVNSTRKKGYVQREFRKALEILAEYPDSEIYLIPIRLDDSDPPQEKLKELQWVDMFPDWESGLKKILLAMNIDTKIRRADDSFRSEVIGLLVDPSSTPEDKLTLLLMLVMKGLDSDIEERLKVGREDPQFKATEVMQMITDRSRMFDQLVGTFRKYDDAAREAIQKINL